MVRGQHLDLLLHLGHARALLVGLGLSASQGFFKRGELGVLLFALRCQQFCFFFAVNGLRCQVFSLNCRIVFARGPLGGLLFELRQALLYPYPAVDHKANFSF